MSLPRLYRVPPSASERATAMGPVAGSNAANCQVPRDDINAAESVAASIPASFPRQTSASHSQCFPSIPTADANKQRGGLRSVSVEYSSRPLRTCTCRGLFEVTVR